MVTEVEGGRAEMEGSITFGLMEPVTIAAVVREVGRQRRRRSGREEKGFRIFILRCG